MEHVLLWLFDMFSYLVSFALDIKIIKGFSLLHLVLSFGLISLLISFITFGENNVNGVVRTALGGFSFGNKENKKDKDIYFKSSKIRTQHTYVDKNGEVHYL